ncbi:YwmB family TATA-box binding protein [Oceanobacillus longus]|uniref:YwmB family TATA-box binding protein n=1 Tax=Oceanobacillus longus TaxID=930120 RepID=A0ABV8GZ78_9BACI
MRKITIILVLLLFITAKPMVNGMERDEMIDLAAFTLENKIAIENWQVTFKENIGKQKAERIVNEFKDSSLVTITEDDNVIKYLLRDVHKDVGLDVSYSVVIPKNQQFKAEIVVVVEGIQWNEQIQEDYVLIKRLIKDKFFTNSLKTFACLTTEDSGIMKTDVFVEEITNYFKLQHIVTQFDTIENSMHEKIIYGYTDLWKQSYFIEGAPMNLQIAVVMDDEMNLEYTIGTPILIHEY